MAEILVVEDDASMRKLLTVFLRDMGHNVRTAAAGRAGLEEAIRAVPQVIILDINLPDMSGYDVARTLRRNNTTASTKIVALTGRTEIEDYQEAKSAGCDGFLAKPVTADQLAEKLKLLLMLKSSA